MSDDHHIATYHTAVQDTFTSIFLRIEHLGRTAEMPDAFVHSGRLHHATVLGNIPEQHGQATVLAVSMFHIADAPRSTVSVQRIVHLALRTHLVTEDSARRTAVNTLRLIVHLSGRNTIFRNIFA